LFIRTLPFLSIRIAATGSAIPIIAEVPRGARRPDSARPRSHPGMRYRRTPESARPGQHSGSTERQNTR